VEGKVVNVVTGEPLGKASTHMRGSDEDTQGLEFNGRTDAGGAFQIREIDPGKFRMTAQRAGFVNQGNGAKAPNRGGPPFTLEPGRR
jgi:hypothetical protein